MPLNLSQPTILLVDDMPMNLAVLVNVLSKEYKLKMVGNAQQSLSYAIANPPDLVLLDVVMPEMDGFEFCRRFKANPSTADIPVIFITAKNDTSDEELGFSLGAADFIHKPISAPIVAARVKAHLKIKFMKDYLIKENARLQSDANQNVEDLLILKDFVWGMQMQKALTDFRPEEGDGSDSPPKI